MRSKLLYRAFTFLQTVYSPDLSNLLFHFIALSLSFRFIILLAACPRHADTILSLNSSFRPAVLSSQVCLLLCFLQGPTQSHLPMSFLTFLLGITFSLLPSRVPLLPQSGLGCRWPHWMVSSQGQVSCVSLTRPCVLHMPDMLQMCATPLGEQFPR